MSANRSCSEQDIFQVSYSLLMARQLMTKADNMSDS